MHLDSTSFIPREIAFLGIFLFSMGVTVGLLIGNQLLLAGISTGLTVTFGLFLFVTRLRNWRQERRHRRAIRKEGPMSNLEAARMGK